MNNLTAKIEALLFIYGEPIKIKKLIELLEVSEDDIDKALTNLALNLKNDDARGLNLLVGNGDAQLVTKPDLMPVVTGMIKQEMDSELTPAALEALSIIVYLGPCGRAEIDYIRGVNSSFTLQNLTIRGLISKKPDHNRGNAFSYQVTFDFLKHIGVSSPEELPDYQKYKDLNKLFKKEKTDNENEQLKSPVENVSAESKDSEAQ